MKKFYSATFVFVLFNLINITAHAKKPPQFSGAWLNCHIPSSVSNEQKPYRITTLELSPKGNNTVVGTMQLSTPTASEVPAQMSGKIKGKKLLVRVYQSSDDINQHSKQTVFSGQYWLSSVGKTSLLLKSFKNQKDKGVRFYRVKSHVDGYERCANKL